LVLPSLYHTQPLTPQIEGTIRSSPAERAGLKTYDVIRKINGRPVLFRTEAKEYLAGECKETPISVEILRNGQVLSFDLAENGDSEASYPYRPPGYPASKSHPYGVVLIDDFNPTWLWNVLHKISQTDAKQILLMSSDIMEPVVAYLLEKHAETEEILKSKNLYLWIPRHRFWGGNIMMGDLYTCSDYLHAIKDFQDQHGIKPDLVIIPSSFTCNNNMDLLGVSYSSIEYATGIPVELAWCSHLTM